MNRSIRNAVAATLAVTLALPAVAQQQSDVQKLSEVVEVRVINLDVVVTDRKGTPITGLTKDDFEIYENGVPKPISNFYEVDGKRATLEARSTTPSEPTAAPATPAKQELPDENLRRRIIFYIDNLSLAPFNRNRVFTQMKEFAKNVMRPGDEAMVATFNRSMKVRVQFTRDPIQIAQTLDVIAGESAMGSSNRSERRDVESRIKEARTYDEAVAFARSYASSVEHDLRQSVASLNALMTTLAGVEGKKILVLTSEGFPMQPGREIFYYIDELSRQKQGWNQGSTLLEGMSFESGSLIKQIGRTANANGITIYPLHAAGLAAGNDNSPENTGPTSFVVSQQAVSNTTESMSLIAGDTGGLATYQTNNFEGAFKAIQRDLDSYYSLGYRAGTERVDRQRGVEVRMKNRNYYARARRSFVEKSTYAEMSDRVVANLLYKSKANDLKILVRVNTPLPTDDGLFRTPLEIQIPMEMLTLLPQGDTEFVGGFEVYVAVANKDGDMSDVARKSHTVRVSSEEMGKIAGKFYTYTLELLMEKGLNKISVGVVDNVTNTSGFAREQIIARDLR